MASSGFKKYIIVITTISAAIMELIDTSIVNVALSDISGNLGATIEDSSWIITAYAIANVIIIPLTGFLQRFFGRKNYYIASIIIFTISSVFCGFAPDLWSLVAWRFIQGIGGGALLSTSQGILFDTFEPHQKGMAAGLFGMGIVLGPTIGPTLGGIIVENYSWPLIFYINIPFGIAATILSLRFIDKKPEEFNINRKAIKIDYPGIALLAIGIASLQYVLEKGQSEDWLESQSIQIGAVLAIVGLVGFVWRELTTEYPAVNLKVMRNFNLVGSNILTFVVGFGLFGSVFIFPVMVQRILGYSPTEAGYSLIPGALVAIIIMPILGRALGGGVKPVYFVIVGTVFFFLHGYLSSQANLDSSRTWFIIPQICRGIGTACLTVPLINQAVVGLKPHEMPHGIALTNMLRQIGGALGIAVMNTYVSRRYVQHRTDLVSNLTPDNPLFTERIQNIKLNFMAKGYDALSAEEAGYRLTDFAVQKQAYLLSYLDGFLLISIFFVCSIPFMLLLRSNKMDKATQLKIQEESH
jgi:DHA2 family multidrug resistance protein